MTDADHLKEFLNSLSPDQVKALYRSMPSPYEESEDDAIQFLIQMFDEVEFIFIHQGL